jgi:antitoxin (DNA-binding transcriptional repressor) of toxin-antitoxin stability system
VQVLARREAGAVMRRPISVIFILTPTVRSASPLPDRSSRPASRRPVPLVLDVRDGWERSDGACSTASYDPHLSRRISQRELSNDSGEIVRKLDEGETCVVTRNGVPVGELTPLRRHRFVAAEAAVALFRGVPSIDYEQFRSDLDAAVGQGSARRA